MKNKLKQSATANTEQSNSQASATGNSQVPQSSAEKTLSNIIVYNNSNSAYDKTARKILLWFLNRWPKRRQRALVSYLVKTNQTYKAFNAFALINERSITYRKTVEEVYQDALNWDLPRPSFIRIWRSNKLTHYICVPEFGIYSDYYGDLWDSAGHLKQAVIDHAISNLKEELLVSNEKTANA